MNILKAGAYSAVSTAARLLSGLIVIKLVAWYSGPAGVGKLGQFMSLMSLLSVLAGGGIGTAVIKYVAEFRSDPPKLRRLLSAAMTYGCTASCIMGLVTLVFSKQITVLLLGDLRFESLIWILAVSQFAIALNNFVIAVINGFMDVRRIALVYIGGAIISVILTGVLAFFFRLYGALLALILGQVASLAVSLPIFRRRPYFDRTFFRPACDSEMIARLAKFSTMALTSAVLPPLVNIWVRGHLAASFSWEQVGYWQAVSKVSEAYLLFITMAISVYYLPKLSSISDRKVFEAELRSAYKHVLPVVVLLAGLIYLMRSWVTQILFNSDFLAANYLYRPQLIGDVIKVSSFILSYIMLAKAMTKTFLFSEILFSLTYVGLVYLLTEKYGLVGAMYAFSLNYLLYFIFTIVIARNYMSKM